MLLRDYREEILKKLRERGSFGKNELSFPFVEKVTLNMRVAEIRENQQLIEEAMAELALISGQKPKICRAKKSVSGFKLRKGEPVGLKVTLRGARMYDFLKKLFALVLPRLRDFKGLSKKQFDKCGNFNIGLPDHTIFPEIDVNKTKKQKGLQVTIVVRKAKDKNQAEILLSELGLPFSKN